MNTIGSFLPLQKLETYHVIIANVPFSVGLLQHKGERNNFSTRFGQGSIIGVHLDTWHGTLTFFKNRKCIGKVEEARCVF